MDEKEGKPSDNIDYIEIDKPSLVLVIRKLTKAQIINVLYAAGITKVRLKTGLKRVFHQAGVPDKHGIRSIAQADEPYDEVEFAEMISIQLVRHLLVEALNDNTKIQSIKYRIVLLIAELLADQELAKKDNKPPTPEERQSEREETNLRIYKELVGSIKQDPKYFITTVQELIASGSL